MLQILQNLNDTQMKVFYLVREWCLKKNFGENPDPLHIFITGGAGTGNSQLIKSIHYEASRILGKNVTRPDCVSVLLTAFTGTAAFNIGGNTIHHLFSLPKCMRFPYEPLGEQTLSQMRVQLEDLKILIIDEISMVYKKNTVVCSRKTCANQKMQRTFWWSVCYCSSRFLLAPSGKSTKRRKTLQRQSTLPS